jgi:hypothetical protein
MLIEATTVAAGASTSAPGPAGHGTGSDRCVTSATESSDRLRNGRGSGGGRAPSNALDFPGLGSTCIP